MSRKLVVVSVVFMIILLMMFGTSTTGNATIKVPPYICVRDFIVIVDKPPEVEPVKEVKKVTGDLYWLARIISAEAKGEPVEGQIAVGNVVMNRVRHKQFPDTVKGVIFQKKQFDPVRNGSINHEPTKQALESARRVLNGEKMVADGTVYFYNPNTVSRGNWIRSRTTIKDIGNHRFAK